MHRPSSAISKRPTSARAASARTTQTKAFFDLRDGTRNEDPPSPFIVNYERSYAVYSEPNEAVLSWLRDSDVNDEFLCGWDILKTEKPRVDIVEPVCLVGIQSIDRCLRGYFGRYSYDGESENPVLVSTETICQGFLNFFSNLFLDSINGSIRAMRNIVAGRGFKRSEASSNDTYEEALRDNEDEFSVSGIADGQHSTQLAVSRIEERIRREIPLYSRPEHTTGQKDGTVEKTPPNKSEIEMAHRADESFWASPRTNEVMQMHGHYRESIVEIAINVEEVKFRQHPHFIDEELILAQINSLYERYRKHIESASLHFLVKKLLGIVQCIGAENEDTPPFQVTIYDLKITSEKLLQEVNCIKDLSLRLKNLRGALHRSREVSGFACTNIEIQSENLSNPEFEDDIQRLKDVIPSLRPFLSTTSCCQENDQMVIEALEAVDSMLYDNLEQCRFPLNLTSGKKVAQPGWIPKVEKARRRKISSERYFARLLIDGHPVGDTKSVTIEWPSFSVPLSHRFHCKLSRRPEKTCIQIFKSRSGFLPPHLVCSIFVGIPLDHLVESGKQESVMDWYEFATEYGLKGAVFISASLQAIPTKSSPIAMVPHIVTSTADISKKKMIRQLKKATNQKHVDVCRCNASSQLMMAFKLGSSTLLSSLFQEPSRHILIRKRQTNPNTVSPIPNLTSQNANEYNAAVERDAAQYCEDIIENAMRERSAVSRQNLTTFVENFMEHSLLRECKRTRTKKQYAEIVQDVGLFRFLDQNELRISTIIPRKRSLYPVSRRRFPTTSSLNKYSLLFAIVLGKNIPTKSNDSSTATAADDPDEVHVGLVVKIQLRGKSYYTRAVRGSTNPFWNETVVIPLDFIEEFDKAPYSLLQEELVDVSVFDCINTDMRNKGGFYDDEETKFVDYRYIGSVTVPFLTLLKHGQVDGFVRCWCPDRIVGYTRQHISSLIANDHDEDPRDLSGKLMIRIHATIDPAVPFPIESNADYPSFECQNLLSRINQWTELSLHRHFMASDISCRILWPDTNGVSCIVSRFITEQRPPHRFKTPESCAHYVSLIPSLTGWRSIEKLNIDGNSVLSSQQTIDILAGKTKEHAVLLANFFLHLTKRYGDNSAEVYLVLGFAIPEGNTVWVMRKCRQSKDIVFWEATSGCAYSCEDDTCPLQRIYCLVSKENVYANLQREKKPHSLDFNLSISRKWAPLNLVDTNGERTLALTPIQDEVLHYSLPNHGYAKELQDELKESIKTAVREWRRTTTSFRTDIVAKLSSILDKLEDSKISGKRPDTSGLDDLSKTRNVFGFPLHFTFTNIKDVLNQIKATEIHRNRNPNVEFSLAVRVFAYPGGLLSVWVFICSLVPK